MATPLDEMLDGIVAKLHNVRVEPEPGDVHALALILQDTRWQLARVQSLARSASDPEPPPPRFSPLRSSEHGVAGWELDNGGCVRFYVRIDGTDHWISESHAAQIREALTAAEASLRGRR